MFQPSVRSWKKNTKFNKFNNFNKNANIKLHNDSCLVFIYIYISKIIDLKIQGYVNKYFFFSNMDVAKNIKEGIKKIWPISVC